MIFSCNVKPCSHLEIWPLVAVNVLRSIEVQWSGLLAETQGKFHHSAPFRLQFARSTVASIAFFHSTSHQCWYVKFKWQLEAIFRWGICLTSSCCNDALHCSWLISQWNQNEFSLSWVDNWVNWRVVANNGGESNKVIEEHLEKFPSLFTPFAGAGACACSEIGSVKVVTWKRQI